jgi:hypothetical protein
MRCFIVTLGVLLSAALPSWAGDKKEPAKAPATYFKVETRGTLHVADKVEVIYPTLARELEKQPVKASITSAGMTMYLAFGDNKELAALAKKLEGKTVLVSGELRRAYEGPISGLCPPRFDDYIQVTALKAAD